MTKAELFDKLYPLCDKYTANLSRKYTRYQLRDDFQQVGRIALWEAIERYDETQGDAWAYSKIRIWGACMDWVRTSAWFPRSMKTMGMASLDSPQGHHYPSSDVAFADVTTWRLALVENITASGEFFHQSISNNDLDDNTGAIEQIYSEQIRKRLLIAARQLPGKQRVIIEGLLDDMPMTEIAEGLGISLGRVSQLAAQALAALRSMSV